MNQYKSGSNLLYKSGMINLILVGFLLLFSFSAKAQQNQPPKKAWEVVYKIQMIPHKDASKEVQEEAREMNARADSLKIRQFISADGYNSTKNAWSNENLIINRKDSTVYMYNQGDNFAYKMSIQEYVDRYMKNSAERYKVTHFKTYPDSIKNILGFSVEKITYDLEGKNIDSLEPPISNVVWYTQALPSWFESGSIPEIDGLPLYTAYTYFGKENGLTVEYVATEIKEVSTDSLVQTPPNGLEIIPVHNNKISYEEEVIPKEFKPEQAIKDSISSLIAHQSTTYDAGSIFKGPFARVEKVGKSFYINTDGKFIFDSIVSNYHPIRKVTPTDQPGWFTIDKDKNATLLIVTKDQKLGIINSKTGKWALSPDYEEIEPVFKRYLKVIKDGKMGYADTWGNILLPPQFDEANIMDGENYFDVRKGKKWGVYSAKKKKMVIPPRYDEFDYCGGCGGEMKYAYASKNGKWGVIDFKNRVLLPFEYGHPGHWGMRGDNWVTSFEQDSLPVVINLKTQKVYTKKDYMSWEVISGILALQKENQYVLVNEESRQISDFEFEAVADPYDSFHWGRYIAVKKNGKYGLVDDFGKFLIQPDTYTDLFIRGDQNYIKTYIGEKAGLLDSLGNELLPNKYQSVNDQFMQVSVGNEKGNQLFEVKEDTLYGWFNAATKKLVSPRFSQISLTVNRDSTQTYMEVAQKIGEGYHDVLKGLYTLGGKEILPPEYDDYDFITQDLLEIKKGDNYGLYSLKKQKMIIPIRYNFIFDVRKAEGILELTTRDEKGSHYHYWSLEKQQFIELPFDKAQPSGLRDLWIVSDDKNTYLYNAEEEKIISDSYPNTEYGNSVGEFKRGLAQVYKNEKYGYINKTGREVIPPKYDFASRSEKYGFIRVAKELGGGFWKDQILDSIGHKITKEPQCYKDESDYGGVDYNFAASNYLFTHQYNEDYGKNMLGVMTQKGKKIIASEYDEIHLIKTNKGFIVKKGQYFGILNRQGRTLIPPVLDNIYFVKEQVFTEKTDIWNIRFPILCQLDEDYFYVDSSGNLKPFVAHSFIQFKPVQNFW